MSALDFIAVIFAAGAIIEVWHKGSIFDTARAYTQALQDVVPADSAKGRLLELINCPFCKSYHAPFYLFLLLLAGDCVGGTIAALIRALVYGLAATRIGNIIDGLLPSRMRYSPLMEEDHG